MTAVATLTGGVDSTYMVWKHLTETVEPVVVYRCDHRATGPTIAPAEEVAAQRVVDWLKANVRDFEYRVIVTPIFQPGEWITLEATRVGAQMVEDGVGDYLLMGRNIEGEKPHRGLKTKAAQHRIYSETTLKGSLRFPLVEQGLGKPNAHRDLPPALLALTVKCNKAEVVDGEIVTCGNCTTGCLYNAMITEKLSDGYTPEQVFDYGQRLMREGPYAGLPIVDRRWITRGFPPVIDFPELHEDTP